MNWALFSNLTKDESDQAEAQFLLLAHIGNHEIPARIGCRHI